MTENRSGNLLTSVHFEKQSKMTNKSKTEAYWLNNISKMNFKESSDKRSTNVSDGITQKQVEFIPNIELEK